MPRDELFTIGEFSAITGVGIYSLRYYDEIGALKPEYVDPVSNYRYYGFRQLSRIPAINICKDAGIRLNEFDSFLTDGEVDYEKLLTESRRSIGKIIDSCHNKERAFDRIEELCSISSGLSSGRDKTEIMHDLDIWAMPYDEISPGSGSSGMLVKLSESAAAHGIQVMPSLYGIIRINGKSGFTDHAFAMIDGTSGDLPCNEHLMSLEGGEYLFSAMDSLSMDDACDIINRRGTVCQTDKVLALALLPGGTSGPLCCAAARLSG